MRTTTTCLLGSLLLFACNSGGSSPSNACATTGQSLCMKGATCSADGGVLFVIGDSGISLSFTDPSSCSLIYTIGCDEQDGGDGGMLTGACAAAVAGAQCGTSMAGPGLVLPPACN